MAKRIILLFFFLHLIYFDVSAAHILGGDLGVTHLQGDSFLVSMKLFRDECNQGASLDASVTLNVFEEGTDLPINLTIFLPQDSTRIPILGDECFSPPPCLEIGYYSAIVQLPPSPNGLYLVWERCCRSESIINIVEPENFGMVFVATIPDPVLQNSSPIFSPYPTDGYFCVNTTNQFSFEALDPDGDSLVYSLDNPLYGELAVNFPGDPNPGGGGPKPTHNPFEWVPPYSLDDPIGGTTPMTIDSQTGEITASPIFIGKFAFSVLVEEYRDGIKIGEVRREITLESTPCEPDLPPIYVGFNNLDTVYLTAFQENSIEVIILDSPLDSIWQTIEGEIFDGPYEVLAEFDTTTYTLGNFSGVVTWDSLGCEMIREEPYRAYFLSNSINACTDSISSDTLELAIYIQLPEDVETEVTPDSTDTSFTYVVLPDTVQCLTLSAFDSNYNDTLALNADFSSELFSLDPPATFRDTSGAVNISSDLCWVPDCEHVRPEPYLIEFTVLTKKCFETDTVKRLLEFYVVTASDGDIDLVPNVFTPNDDDKNDQWELIHTPDKCVTEEEIQVFNRWGNKVYSSFSLLGTWDGEVDGPAPEGAYYYIITYEFLQDPRTYTGNVTIFR